MDLHQPAGGGGKGRGKGRGAAEADRQGRRATEAGRQGVEDQLVCPHSEGGTAREGQGGGGEGLVRAVVVIRMVMW